MQAQHPSGVAREVQVGDCRSGEEERKNRSLEAENKELRARLEALEKKEGEGVQGGQGLPSKEKSGMEEEWGMDMDVEEEIESSKKLDEQRRKLQMELRDIEKFSCVPKEFQENFKSNLQHQLQEVEQRRHNLMPEHQKVPKISKNTKHPGQESRKLQKKQYRSRRSFKRSLSRRKTVSFLSVKQSRKEQDGGCRNGGKISESAGRRRRNRNASQTGDCCVEALWQQLIALGANRVRYREIGPTQGREEVRRNSEEGQEQGKASQQLALSASGERVVWSLIFLVFGVPLVNAEEQGNQVQQGIEEDLCPTPQVDFRWKRMLQQKK